MGDQSTPRETPPVSGPRWWKDPKSLLMAGGWLLALLFGTGLVPAFFDLEIRKTQAALAHVEATSGIRTQLSERMRQLRTAHEVVVSESTERRQSCWDHPDRGRLCHPRESITNCDLMELLVDDVTELEARLAELENRLPRDLMELPPVCAPRGVTVEVTIGGRGPLPEP